MCDEDTVRDNERASGMGVMSRRTFAGGALSAAALFALLPRTAHAASVTESDVSVRTPDGVADCYFVHPAIGKAPAVIVWPDILGLRPAFRAMGKRLAESGYAVLVVNPYYRTAKAPVVPVGASFQDPATRETLMKFARTLSPATNTTDARAFAAFLDAQPSVDTARRMGTTGYCMGGPITLRTAAALPDRIGAGASFHGGGLVTDKPDSPHLLVPQTKASYLFAIAANDDERDPTAKDVLRETYAKAGLAAEIEVYAGAMHGWCPPDSPVYNEAQAERAWSRLLALFARALA
jgi:carboxymethylenebutenolidase